MKYTEKIKKQIIYDYINLKPIKDIYIKYNIAETSFRRVLKEKKVKSFRQNPKPLFKLSKEQKAYIAGIVDGEGCIAIDKRTDRDYKHGYSFMATLRVGNTYKRLIDYLNKVTGLGSINFSKKEDIKYKDYWSWRLHTQQASQLIKVILPYLIVKKKQAKIILKFNQLKKINYGQHGRDGIPDFLWNKQKFFYLKVKKLNQRGKL